MTNSLHIVDILNNKDAMSQEDAQQLLPSLENAVKKQEDIYLSFEGLEVCSSIFLNNLLGKLYLAFGENVDKYVHFTGIDPDDTVIIDKLERLRRRALNPEIYQPIFDSAFGQA